MKKKLRTMLTMFLIASSTMTVFANDLTIDNNTQPDIVEQIINEIKEEDKQVKEETKREIILSLDSSKALIDGAEHEISTKPIVIEGRTYLPLRFMGDKLLEANVSWDNLAKEVTIVKNEKNVRVKVGSKKAYIDGDEIEILNEPIIHKSSTYLPLRTMANLFDISIDYNEATRQITLGKSITPSKPVVKKPPIAQFEFGQSEYVEGQVLTTVDKSYHEDGKKITNRLWMIDFNEKHTNSKLENMFSRPRAGTYQVSLKVEAGKDNWSEWTTKEITIKPNQKPVITYFNTYVDVYAAGEEIGFTYTFDNEPWEGLKSERWTYRRADEPLNKAVIDKPKFIFYEGEYVATLQIEDANGNWSDVKETRFRISSEVKQNELEYRFTQGNIGDIIDNFQNFNYQTYPLVEDMTTELRGGELIVSNSPESVRAKGILYREKAKNKGRFVFHHHNAFTEEENAMESKKLVVVAKNTSNQDVTFTLTNKVVKGPTTDILYVGQQLLYEYLSGVPAAKYTLKPGEQMYIYDSGNRKWGKGQLISGKMDYEVYGEIELIVAAVAQNTKIEEVEYMDVLDRDAHPRGTFPNTDIFYDVELESDSPSKIILGAGTEEWLKGYDALTFETTQNRGNYGVNYIIKITAKEDTGVILNPRAGVFRGAIRWDFDKAYLAPAKGYFMGHNSKATTLGVIKAGETRTLEYTLPNGSASPVVLGFIPKSHWNQ